MFEHLKIQVRWFTLATCQNQPNRSKRHSESSFYFHLHLIFCVAPWPLFKESFLCPRRWGWHELEEFLVPLYHHFIFIRSLNIIRLSEKVYMSANPSAKKRSYRPLTCRPRLSNRSSQPPKHLKNALIAETTHFGRACAHLTFQTSHFNRKSAHLTSEKDPPISYPDKLSGPSHFKANHFGHSVNLETI